MKPTTVIFASQDEAQPTSGGVAHRRLRQGYALVSALLALAILFQVFVAGGGLFSAPSWWPTHRMVGMALSLGPLVLLALGAFARLPGRTLWLNALLLVLVGLQPVLISVPEQLELPILKALHVVNALVLFALTVFLGQQAWGHFTRPRVRPVAQATRRAAR